MKKFALSLLFSVLALTPVLAQTNYGKFTVTAPVVLQAEAPTKGTTHGGQPYTFTTYSAVLPNTDYYMVAVADYSFSPTNDDLERAVNGFVSGINGTIIDQKGFQIASGQLATIVVISAKGAAGRELRVGLVVSYKGNSLYQFAFASYVDVASDLPAVKTFFRTLQIN